MVKLTALNMINAIVADAGEEYCNSNTVYQLRKERSK